MRYYKHSEAVTMPRPNVYLARSTPRLVCVVPSKSRDRLPDKITSTYQMSNKAWPTMQNPTQAIHEHSPSLIVDYSNAPETYHEAPQHVPQTQQEKELWNPQPGRSSRICGISRQTFCFALILLAVVVTAAVGGGVGGSLAVEHAKK
jgi:hypothetical protein